MKAVTWGALVGLQNCSEDAECAWGESRRKAEERVWVVSFKGELSRILEPLKLKAAKGEVVIGTSKLLMSLKVSRRLSCGDQQNWKM